MMKNWPRSLSPAIEGQQEVPTEAGEVEVRDQGRRRVASLDPF
jgi:hypothetical protein